MAILRSSAIGGLAVGIILGGCLSFLYDGLGMKKKGSQEISSSRGSPAIPSKEKRSLGKELQAMSDEADDSFSRSDFGAIHALCNRIAVASRTELLEALDEVDKESRTRMPGQLALMRLAEIDPAAAFSLFKEMNFYQVPMHVLYSKWVAQDLDGALASLDEFPERARESGLHLIAMALAPTDLDRALSLVLAPLKNGEVRRDEVLVTVFSGAAENDPVRAANQALALPIAEDRRWATIGVFKRWFEQDRNAALSWIDSIPDDRARDEAIARVMRKWGKSDLRGLAVYVARPPANESEMLCKQAVQILEQQDSRRALAWARSLPAKHRLKIEESCYETWGQRAPSDALESIMQIESADVRKQMMGAVLPDWVSLDYGAALAWLDSLKSDSPGIEHATVFVCRGLATRDPAKAVVLLERLGEEMTAERDLLIPIVTKEYAGRDWAGMLRWAASLPAGKLKDAAAQAIVLRTEQTQPSLAWEWAESISNEGQRAYQLGKVAKAWLQSNPPAARSAIEKAAFIPAEEKNRLLQTK